MTLFSPDYRDMRRRSIEMWVDLQWSAWREVTTRSCSVRWCVCPLLSITHSKWEDKQDTSGQIQCVCVKIYKSLNFIKCFHQPGILLLSATAINCSFEYVLGVQHSCNANLDFWALFQILVRLVDSYVLPPKSLGIACALCLRVEVCNINLLGIPKPLICLSEMSIEGESAMQYHRSSSLLLFPFILDLSHILVSVGVAMSQPLSTILKHIVHHVQHSSFPSSAAWEQPCYHADFSPLNRLPWVYSSLLPGPLQM